MPRRSKADHDLHVVSLGLPERRKVEPPPEIIAEPELLEVWKQTVEPMRPDHFNEAMFPLLVNYCRSVAASRMLWAERRRRSINDRDYGRLVRMCDTQDREVLALARSLRLTPRSRRDPIDARWSQSRPKPWED
jgi:hypothetical protein